jgi:hypothetical protein
MFLRAGLENAQSFYEANHSPGLENAQSFYEANHSSSLDQGKHLSFTLYRFLLYNIYIMSMIVHLSIGV